MTDIQHTNIRSQPVKKAMYKIIDDTMIIIATDTRGVPVIIEQKI
jgi:hypothetical protein